MSTPITGSICFNTGRHASPLRKGIFCRTGSIRASVIFVGALIRAPIAASADADAFCVSVALAFSDTDCWLAAIFLMTDSVCDASLFSDASARSAKDSSPFFSPFDFSSAIYAQVFFFTL
jgi:hypothetical protein